MGQKDFAKLSAVRAMIGETDARHASAEEVLIELGYTEAKVYPHGDLARIQTAPDEAKRILDDTSIAARLRNFGFTYVTLELR